MSEVEKDDSDDDTHAPEAVVNNIDQATPIDGGTDQAQVDLPNELSQAEQDDCSEKKILNLQAKMKRKRFEKLERNREKVYEILNFLFKVSRYLETYYRWDDILIIDLDINKKLAICDFWKNIEVGFENMKLYLQSKKLPNTVEYKPGLDMIINDLRIARVYIDTSEFTPNSWQQKDYAAIWSQIIIYGVDDEVMILDDDAPPPRESIMELELKRPFCTLGCYDMTLYEFTSSKLTAENLWHSQMRFHGTKTSNIQTRSERLLHDKAWIEARTDNDEKTRSFHPNLENFKSTGDD